MFWWPDASPRAAARCFETSQAFAAFTRSVCLPISKPTTAWTARATQPASLPKFSGEALSPPVPAIVTSSWKSRNRDPSLRVSDISGCKLAGNTLSADARDIRVSQRCCGKLCTSQPKEQFRRRSRFDDAQIFKVQNNVGRSGAVHPGVEYRGLASAKKGAGFRPGPREIHHPARWPNRRPRRGRNLELFVADGLAIELDGEFPFVRGENRRLFLRLRGHGTQRQDAQRQNAQRYFGL